MEVRMFRRLAGLALVPLALTACDSTGPESGAGVRIQFRTAVAPSAASLGVNSAADFTINGSEGTLTLSDIHFIVDKFELERQDGACDAAVSAGLTSAANGDDDHPDREDHECEEFEAGPFFIGLQLGSQIPVVTQDVPAGTYTRLKFEVEDIQFGEDRDDHHGSDVQGLMQDIVSAGFTDWPDRASMVVTGTFTPAGGTPKPFTAYFDAELNIRQTFDPPLVVSDAATTVTVEVDPTMWFSGADGHVMDLSAFDFETTGRVVEFSTHLRDGFHRIEHDHD
jgi:hypothetical protein